ncbi:MAG: RAD55 family ATPase [Candidatus Hodarchaeota archaeon]
MLLESIISGGLPAGSSVLLVGPPGSGKTLISLQLAHEATISGQDALYLSTENTPSTVFAQAKGFGLALNKEEKSSILFVDAYSWRIGMHKDLIATSRISNPGNLNEVNMIVTNQAKLLRPKSLIVIDSLSGLTLATPDEQRIRTFVHSLALRIAQINQVLILVLEDQAHDRRLINNMRSLVQGTLNTKVVEADNGQMQWKLRLYSLIGASYTTQWFTLVPGPNGLELKGGDSH